MANQAINKQNDLNVFLNNYFNIILAIALILFLLIAYFAFLGPKFRATQEAIKANTEEKQLLYETTQKRLASLKAVSEVYRKINPTDLQKFNSVLPDAYIRERLFGELEEIVGRGGWLVSHIAITPEEEAKAPAQVVNEEGVAVPASAPAAKTKKIGTVNVQLQISAIDYPGFKNLLRMLESNLRLFDVTNIEVSPSGNTAAITLSTYYYKSN